MRPRQNKGTEITSALHSKAILPGSLEKTGSLSPRSNYMYLVEDCTVDTLGSIYPRYRLVIGQFGAESPTS